MKYLFPVIVLSLAFAGSCKKKPVPAGNGFSVTCQCWKDTVTKSYLLGNKYIPYDSSSIIPYYLDSCNAIKVQNGYDSSKVFVLSL
jgi:hypothetical protein